jgi:hypothetical protein
MTSTCGKSIIEISAFASAAQLGQRVLCSSYLRIEITLEEAFLTKGGIHDKMALIKVLRAMHGDHEGHLRNQYGGTK